ncbi:YdcH family protein [Oceanicella actignis]|uniref:YdcH family protein n=1 Tax=Oceanicella actignis TaxID=1189325 RepID=UPI0011E7620A|nr:YdcH family protein [Oceanicella actignis]
MSVTERLGARRRRHAELSDAIERAERAPGMDRLHIVDLKKQKLALKQEIAAIETQ